MTQTPYPRHQRIDTQHIQSIRMGTTVATNALLERNGASTILVINRGFQDLLFIGDQSRPKIFDLKIQRPEVSHTIYISPYLFPMLLECRCCMKM